MSKKEKVKALNELPINYRFYKKMDLNEDPKTKNIIQMAFILIVIFMVILSKKLSLPMNSDLNLIARVTIVFMMMLFYMITHEWIHGCFFKLFSNKKPIYLRRGLYLCTGSMSYLSKKSFITTALAPVIIQGLVLVLLLFIVPSNLFFSIYIITVLNFAGASGDYFQTIEVMKLPENAFIQDTGVETKVYIL